MKDTYRRFGPMIALTALMLVAGGCVRAVAGNAGRREQIVAQARERFAAADTDHDGFLTRDEAAKGMPRVADHFDEIDARHAGKVSLDDILHYLAARRAHGDAGI